MEFLFLKPVTVGEAPTDFVLLTKEQLHRRYKGFLRAPRPCKLATTLVTQIYNVIRQEGAKFLSAVMC